MKKYIIFITLFFLFNIVFSQSKKTEIVFYINDTLIDLSDDFNLYIVIVDSSQKFIIHPSLKNNILHIDSNWNNISGKYFYVLSYKGKNYSMPIHSLASSQNMKEVFKYIEEKFILNDESLKATFTLNHEPQEYGDGTAKELLIIYINDFFQIGDNLLNIDIDFY